MNFLAHLYLSGGSDEVKIGNFIADYVKGKDYEKYPNLIKKGILLHRKIDSFTDSHPVVRKHKSFFYKKYHKYAGVLTDIIYDHFLIKDWRAFSNENFDDYVDEVNDLIENSYEYIPPEMEPIAQKFTRNKWLKAYETLEGIQSVFIGMSKGTSLPDETDFAMYVIKKNYNQLKHDFLDYFPQLIDFAENEMRGST